MKQIGTRLAGSFLSLVLVLLPMAAVALDLTVVSFNGEYYGLGGDANGTPASEKRDPFLKPFFATQVPRADVLMLEEMVDVDRFRRVIVPDWRCITYPHPNPKHQHVAMCIRPGLQFVHEPSDNNDIIDAVAVEERSRPALHLLLAGSDGKPFLRLIGVHLKAFPDFSKTRDYQVGVIAEYLKHVANPRLPILIAGDTNTYPKGENGRDIDDSQVMDTIYGSLGFVQIPNGNHFTYRTPEHAGTFDRFWISSLVRPNLPLWVHPICSGQNVPVFKDIAEYNRLISDHCPVAVRLHL